MTAEPYDNIKLMIGVPSTGSWESDFGISLVNAALGVWSDEGLTALKNLNVVKEGGGVDILTMVSRGSLLPSQRTDIVRRAQAKGCTHLLFVDDDMTFPMHSIIGLLARNVDIVGANCATKAIPPSPTARMGEKEDEELFTRYDSRGLKQVTRLGTGVLMIKMEVFEKLSEPWFSIPWEEEKQGFIGEDVFFCRRAIEAGFNLHVDQDLSRQVGHVGRMEYCHQLMPEFHYGDRAEPVNVDGEEPSERRDNDKEFIKDTIDSAILSKKAWDNAKVEEAAV